MVTVPTVPSLWCFSILYCSILTSPPTPLGRVPSSISLQVNLWRGCLLHSGPLIHPPSFFRSSLKSEPWETLNSPVSPSSYRPSTSWNCTSSSPPAPPHGVCLGQALLGPGPLKSTRPSPFTLSWNTHLYSNST